MLNRRVFGTGSREVIRVKVKKCDGLLAPEYKKFSVDPQITSFEVLQNLLARAFDIRGEFTISYMSQDDYGEDVYLSLLSDWDLDAAFLGSSEPCLQLKVDLKPFDGMEDWDVIGVLDVPHSKSSRDRGSFLNTLTESITSQVGRTVSHVQKAIGLKSEIDYRPSKPPMGDQEFHNFLDNVGNLVQPQEFRLSIYQGGCEPSLRKVVWRHLLNIFPENMTGLQRFDYLKRKALEYENLKKQWQGMVKDNEELEFITNMVKKDVTRTDRTNKFFAGGENNKNVLSLFNILVTYAFMHPDVSYCQGMSDVASPLLFVQQDEAHAYICFCALMKRLKHNFTMDGEAMTIKFQHLSDILQHQDPEFHAYLKSQDADDLFFCYRWLLLELKREFPFSDALYMLEVMWSSLPPDPPEHELELKDPRFDFTKIQASPKGKETVYARLRNRCRTRTPRSTPRTSVSDHANVLDFGKENNKPLDMEALQARCIEEVLQFEDSKEYTPLVSEESKSLLAQQKSIEEALFENLPKECENQTTEKLSNIEESCDIERDIHGNGEMLLSNGSCDEITCDQNLDISCDQNSNGMNGNNSQENLNLVTDFQDPSSDHSQRVGQSVFYISLHSSDEEEEIFSVDKKSKNQRKNKLSNVNPKSLLPQTQRDDVSTDSGNGIELLDEKSNRGSPNFCNNGYCDSGFTENVNFDGSYEDANQNRGPLSVDYVKVAVEKLKKLPSPQEFGYGNPFLMLLCLALLMQQRNHIMHNHMDYNDLAMHFDKMVRKHNVHLVLKQAQSMYTVYLRNQAQEQFEDSTEAASELDASI